MSVVPDDAKGGRFERQNESLGFDPHRLPVDVHRWIGQARFEGGRWRSRALRGEPLRTMLALRPWNAPTPRRSHCCGEVTVTSIVAALFVTIWHIYRETIRDWLPLVPVGPTAEGGGTADNQNGAAG